jgi:hypothetical protein
MHATANNKESGHCIKADATTPYPKIRKRHEYAERPEAEPLQFGYRSQTHARRF